MKQQEMTLEIPVTLDEMEDSKGQMSLELPVAYEMTESEIKQCEDVFERWVEKEHRSRAFRLQYSKNVENVNEMEIRLMKARLKLRKSGYRRLLIFHGSCLGCNVPIRYSVAACEHCNICNSDKNVGLEYEALEDVPDIIAGKIKPKSKYNRDSNWPRKRRKKKVETKEVVESRGDSWIGLLLGLAGGCFSYISRKRRCLNEYPKIHET